MEDSEIKQHIMDMPDEVLARLTFSVPWQYDITDQGYKDPDGFTSELLTDKDDTAGTRERLQQECWTKFHRNPHINTSTRGIIGRLTGYGFETSSEILEIDECIQEIELDPRNRLYDFWPKYVGRAQVEGELFLLLTCHDSGFIEVDFIDPSVVKGAGDTESGIIWHPKKHFMPLFYSIKHNNGDLEPTDEQIPSIFMARYPELDLLASQNKHFVRKKTKNSRNRKKKFKKFNGYYRFIVAWNKGLLTRRAISYMRTTLEWLNHYENLKKYEIDHKKSAGAYVWVFSVEEPRMFRHWLSLSDEDKRKTGIMAKKTPGGSLFLPPGIGVEVKSPQLARIAEEDTDIMDMIASGLNEPEDVLLGRSKSTYASIKAGRGPMNDRTSDEIAYFERFLKYDFWDSIFFLRSQVDEKFRYIHKVREAVNFKKDDGEPVFENRKRKACQLIDITFPVSELIDYEARARGLMGVKHGPASDTLGIPYSEVAKRMGFGNYGRMRLRYETEKDKYPELVYALDAESLQESVEAEPKKGATKTTKKE